MYKAFAVFVLLTFHNCAFSQQLTPQIVSGLYEMDSLDSEVGYLIDFERLDEVIDVVGDLLLTESNKGIIVPCDTIYNFECLFSEDSTLNVYSFSHYSGGTRGTIHLPILQFKKSDGSYSAIPLWHFEDDINAPISSYYQIEKLPSDSKNLYLLIGTEKGDNILYSAYARVVEVKNDAINLEYNGFQFKFEVLQFWDDLRDQQDCIACIDFDKKELSLSIVISGENDELNLYSRSEKVLLETNDTGVITYTFKEGTFQKVD